VNSKTAWLPVPQASARPTDFMYAVDRLRDEHEQLIEQTKAIYNIALEASREEDLERSIERLRGLREQVESFVQELKAHALWEEQDMIPLVSPYFAKGGSSFSDSLELLERDLELAALFLETFMELTEKTVKSIHPGMVRHAASQMMQACLIWQEHFRMEEELIFPLADEMLTRLDYFYS
jgi:regulator of cell morphogenesis and NO signaling